MKVKIKIQNLAQTCNKCRLNERKSQQKHETPIQLFGEEIISNICSYLDIKDIIRLSQINKHFHETILGKDKSKAIEMKASYFEKLYYKYKEENMKQSRAIYKLTNKVYQFVFIFKIKIL